MGRELVSAELTANLSHHNSEQDVSDRAAWDRLLDQVRALIAADPQLSYETGIAADLSG